MANSEAEKNGTAVAYCELAHTPYPPHFEQQEGRATTDNKHVSTFGWYQAVTATA